MANNSYHIQFFEPNENWPEGGWSLYNIDGDQIADRVIREKIVKPERGPAYYTGKVIARHSWCGYIGTYNNLPALMEAIQNHKSEKKGA